MKGHKFVVLGAVFADDLPQRHNGRSFLGVANGQKREFVGRLEKDETGVNGLVEARRATNHEAILPASGRAWVFVTWNDASRVDTLRVMSATPSSKPESVFPPSMFPSNRPGVVHDRPSVDVLGMASPGPAGGAVGGGSGGPAGGAGGTAGAPPSGKYGLLRVISGNDQGKTFELKNTTTSIGRGADQMLIVADIAVSRRHLQIHMSGNGYRMQDMGSPNGSMVNGKRQTEAQLFDNDQIEIGNTTMRFEHAPSRAQAEPPPMVQQPPPMMQPPQMMQPQMMQPQMMQPQMGSYAGPGPGGFPPQPAYPQSFPPQPMPPQMPMGTGGVQAPMATGTPASLQSSSVPMSGEGAPQGPLAFLNDARKRTLYLGVLGGAFLFGVIGLGVTSALRSSGSSKSLDDVLALYTKAVSDFQTNRFEEAKKNFQAIAEKAPDSAMVKRYLEQCEKEVPHLAAFKSATQALDDRKYLDALKEYEKIPKDSTMYEDAQAQVRTARREAVKTLIAEANALLKNDQAAALAKVTQGLDLDPESPELLELKTRVASAKPEEVVEAAPPEKPEKPEPVVKKAEPVVKKSEPPKAAGGGDLETNKQAAAAYKNRDFAGAISALQASKHPKAAATIKDIQDVKVQVERGAKSEASNPKDALLAYQTAQTSDRRLGSGLSGFLAPKISAMQAKASGARPTTPGGDPAKEAQADQLLAQARSLATKNPRLAKDTCRKVMQLLSNNPNHPKVKEALKLMQSIKGGKDDDDDF